MAAYTGSIDYTVCLILKLLIIQASMVSLPSFLAGGASSEPDGLKRCASGNSVSFFLLSAK